MSFRDDDDDTSGGSVTQGGHRDAGSSGPARRSGKSFMWFAAVLVVAVVVAVVWLGGRPHRRAPAEANTVTLSQRLGGGGEARPACRPCRARPISA